LHNNADPLDPSKLWLLNDHRLGRKESDMMIIGVDYHPSFQQIAFLVEETGGETTGPIPKSSLCYLRSVGTGLSCS